MGLRDDVGVSNICYKFPGHWPSLHKETKEKFQHFKLKWFILFSGTLILYGSHVQHFINYEFIRLRKVHNFGFTSEFMSN